MSTTSFTIKPMPRVSFGPGAIRQLPDLLGSELRRILLITGSRSLVNRNAWSELRESLQQKRITWFQASVDGEPSPEVVDQITGNHRDRDIQAVVAIGGGSVLDAGKAVAAMLTMSGSVADYLEGVGSRLPAGTTLPLLAAPTTAGTGSEATANAVLSRVGPNGFKKSLRHQNYVPCRAVLDPELLLDTPGDILLRCGLDAFSQLLESYLSTNGSPFTDDLAHGALVRLSSVLPALGRRQAGLEKLAIMSYGACISGITLTNAGLGLVHGFASEIGSRLALPHGTICGALMAPANAFTLAKLRRCATNPTALDKYTALGRLFDSHKASAGRPDHYFQDRFIAVLEELSQRLPDKRLGSTGLKAEDLPAIARQSSNKNNPVEFTAEERQEILNSCL